ncbi:hypothetical protein BC830DRAFT_462426 [Chytriomyces sp. MP71]|nr:hypothetical protein BC830DRAFT_462426 [Chytriomyces sp. MP71]
MPPQNKLTRDFANRIKEMAVLSPGQHKNRIKVIPRSLIRKIAQKLYQHEIFNMAQKGTEAIIRRVKMEHMLSQHWKHLQLDKRSRTIKTWIFRRHQPLLMSMKKFPLQQREQIAISLITQNCSCAATRRFPVTDPELETTFDTPTSRQLDEYQGTECSR